MHTYPSLSFQVELSSFKNCNKIIWRKKFALLVQDSLLPQ